MKRKIIFLFFILAFSCKKENQPPICEITHPENNTSFELGDDIAISIEASDSDGNIDEIRLYFDDFGITSIKELPYTYTIITDNYDPGGYEIKAIAIDNGGLESTDEIQVQINAALPTVTTNAITSITDTSAISGGNITSDGGTEVTARGVCWSKSENPTILNDYTFDNIGKGTFISTITGLECGTTYYVRAYAKNTIGTAYGSQVVFSTSQCPVLEFVFTSTGDGSGLGVFNIMVSEDIAMSIDGTGKFYDDLPGTQNERTSEILTADILNRVYIKVPSGTATLRVKNIVTKWGDDKTGGAQIEDGWNTAVTHEYGTNCPSVSIDVSTLTHCTSINVFGLNTIYGDVSELTSMTYMEIADGTPNHTTPGSGGATCTGDISGMSGLKVIDVWDETAFTGTVNSTNHPLMETIWINGYNSFTIDVENMASLRTLIVLDECDIAPSGDISTCSDLRYLYVYGNTLTGSLSELTDLYSITILEDTGATLPNVTAQTALTNILVNITFTTENVNQLLADVWANRDEDKIGGFRRIDLTREGASGAPSGQGIIDKANLKAYRSPNNDGQYPLWTILTY